MIVADSGYWVIQYFQSSSSCARKDSSGVTVVFRAQDAVSDEVSRRTSAAVLRMRAILSRATC